MTNTTVKKIVRVTTYCNGIKGRDRKVKNHYDKILDIPMEQILKIQGKEFDQSDLVAGIKLAKPYLNEIQEKLSAFKEYNKLTISLHEVSVKTEGVFKIESSMIFEDLRFKSEELGIPGSYKKPVKAKK